MTITETPADTTGHRRGRTLTVILTVLLLLAVAGVVALWRLGFIFNSPTVDNAPSVTVPDEAVRTVASKLEVPWGTAFLPDGTAVVTERNSKRILTVAQDGTVTEAGRVDDAAPAGEGGLMGVAVSPTYATDQLVYVFYTGAQDNRVVRMKLGGTPEPVFTGIPKSRNHNGGRLGFGPDGMLYIGTGDAGDEDGAQDPAFLGGKILRVTPDGKPAPGNPTAGSAVYSLGHRNPQGLAWDSRGRLFAAEFGQNRYDELNVIRPGGNYGWPKVEGIGNDPSYVDPLATWTVEDASPSGIAIVGDKLYMACLRGEKVYRVNLDGTGAEALLSAGYGRIRTVTAAPDGSLWVSTSNKDGRGSPAEADDRILRLRL